MAATPLAVVNEFLKVCLDDILEQLTNGVATPTAAFSKLCGRGEEGFILWQSYIETCTRVKFHCSINAPADTVTLIPLEPMSPRSVASCVTSVPSDHTTEAGQPSANSLAATPSKTTALDSPPAADHKGSAKDKVRRPPNAFIIYRQEWHPKVVRDNPNRHNNDISVIIGNKWKAEIEGVKNEYKRRAEDAKRQHAIDHPGYQYQPRKPSEKKKRMTKTKLAKMKAQADAAIAPDPMKDLNEMLTAAASDQQVTVDKFPAPYRQGFPKVQQSQEDNNYLTFDANSEAEPLLYNQLFDFNSNHPDPTGAWFQEPAVIESQPLADGQIAIGVPQLDLPYVFAQADDSYGTFEATVTSFQDLAAEVERQELLNDNPFELFIDMNEASGL